MNIYADLHIHVGFANNRFVKIPSSKDMTLRKILQVSKYEKGLQCISIVDFINQDVLIEFNSLLQDGVIVEKDNNFYYDNMLIIPSCEIELRFGSKGFHCLIYFDDFDKIRLFKTSCEKYLPKNVLSCPVFRADISKLEQIIDRLNLLLIPAHAFTPYKGFYSCSCNIKNVFKHINVYSVELGLSADTGMVKCVEDVNKMSFLTNSDAHSLKNIAREFNCFYLTELKTKDVFMAIIENKILANFGLNPRLGKYHKTFCKNCKMEFNINNDFNQCPNCFSDKIIVGVEDRINTLKKGVSDKKRPPYYYTFPFELIDGFGIKTQQKILKFFGDEISFLKYIYSDNDLSMLNGIINHEKIERIKRFKEGNFHIKYGAGGFFGRIKYLS